MLCYWKPLSSRTIQPHHLKLILHTSLPLLLPPAGPCHCAGSALPLLLVIYGASEGTLKPALNNFGCPPAHFSRTVFLLYISPRNLMLFTRLFLEIVSFNSPGWSGIQVALGFSAGITGMNCHAKSKEFLFKSHCVASSA